MNKWQRLAVASLSVLACALALLVVQSGFQAYHQWSDQALGAALPTSPYTPIALPATRTPPADASTPIGGSAVTPAPRCGGPTSLSILLIGSDTRSTGYTWGLADVIRVARIDFATPRLTVLDFPRDLWVEIPEIADNLNGQDHEKLNQAYLYGNPGDGFGYWDDPSAGPGLLARTLDLNFGVKTDHYLAVNMQTFVRVVDAVGGIDVVLEHRVAGSDDIHLQAGRHHLSGSQALAVARDRSKGVFSRDDNQNLVLCALQKKLTSPSVLPKVPQLIQSFQGSVQTDLDPRIVGQLACLAGQMPAANITLYSFPESIFGETRIYDPVFKKSVFIWDVDTLVLRNYVAQFQRGGWPDSEAEAKTSGSSTFCQ
ncbi:MAG TPA: LCP family protein [Anaerolineales bacterium]